MENILRADYANAYIFSTISLILNPVLALLVPLLTYRPIELGARYKHLIAVVFFSAWVAGWAGLAIHNQMRPAALGIAPDDPVSIGVKAFQRDLGLSLFLLLGVFIGHALKICGVRLRHF